MQILLRHKEAQKAQTPSADMSLLCFFMAKPTLELDVLSYKRLSTILYVYRTAIYGK